MEQIWLSPCPLLTFDIGYGHVTGICFHWLVDPDSGLSAGAQTHQWFGPPPLAAR